ncbi:hypothetical protein CAK95_07575 [Pseudorhodoplanes sinuspersici]|uniref:Threonine transporter n=2 Tax=Pseudorhodoplanes sinuspersici TaxID=1235591 RepID=A0A1W6ZZQ2_9HYPH|nr:hypothetical protein CAK95_07575 [Pseudorhodoplanes sinuspersici]
MAALAALPSSSVALVVLRSASLGVRSGIAAAFGIAFADLVFVALAVAGMTALSEIMGSLFAGLRYLGAIYLIWCGIGLIRSNASTSWQMPHCWGGSGASFLAGFILTLGDVKAILFYAALFPVFIDIPTLDALDLGVIAAITLVAVGGVKIAYAMAARSIAEKVGMLPLARPARVACGGVMVGIGGYLMVKP